MMGTGLCTLYSFRHPFQVLKYIYYKQKKDYADHMDYILIKSNTLPHFLGGTSPS